MSDLPSKPPPFGDMPPDTYATYRDERNRLTDAEREYSSQFDKYILTLSGGAIALSLAFLRDLVGENPIQGACLLIWSWVGLTLAVGMVVVGLFLNPLSQRHFRCILDELAAQGGDRYWGRVRAAQSKCKLPGFIGFLNCGSVVAFVLGLGLLLGFAYRSVSGKGLEMNDVDKSMSPATPVEHRPIGGGGGSTAGTVDRAATTEAPLPEGRAGAPPALGPVDRVTVSPGPPPPTSAPAGSQPTTPPATPDE